MQILGYTDPLNELVEGQVGQVETCRPVEKAGRRVSLSRLLINKWHNVLNNLYIFVHKCIFYTLKNAL